MLVCNISPDDKFDYNIYLNRYKKIAIIHDSKSIFTASHYLSTKLDNTNKSIKVFNRQASEIWSTTNLDEPEYQAQEVFDFFAGD